MLNYNDVVAVNSRHSQVAAPTLADLSGKRIAVVVGSEEVGEAQKVPHAAVKEYGNITDSLLALSSGRVAADFQPGVDIAWAKHKNPSLHVKILGTVPSSITPPVASLRGYYGLPKGKYSASFLQKLNAYLHKIAANGTEQKMLDRYGMTQSVFLKGIAAAPNAYHGGS
jgi:ABC-type amino acid transport substrate-binding protein